MTRQDAPWLAGAILCGGVIGPLLLMAGLRLTPASSASLLLNLEGVFTALLVWFVFKENFDARIAWGMALISLGAAVLSWAGKPVAGVPWGSLAVVGACLAWALDNNLTRKVSAAVPSGLPLFHPTRRSHVSGAVAHDGIRSEVSASPASAASPCLRWWMAKFSST